MTNKLGGLKAKERLRQYTAVEWYADKSGAKTEAR